MYWQVVYKTVIGAENVQARCRRVYMDNKGSDDGIVYGMLIEAVEKGWTPEIHFPSGPVASPNFLYATC